MHAAATHCEHTAIAGARASEPAQSHDALRSTIEREAAAARAEVDRIRAEHYELMQMNEAERSRAATVTQRHRSRR